VTLADVSIRNPVFAWMLMAFLVVFGGICWSRTGISQNPDVDHPIVGVSVTLEGAAPEIIETDVLDVIEDAVMSVEGIEDIASTARHGRGSVSITFDLKKDIDVAVQEIQAKIAQAQNQLPRDIDPPTVSKSNADDQMILWVALSGWVAPQELTNYAKNVLRDRIQQVTGVGDIYMGGYLDRSLRVWLKAEELEARELTVEDVLGALRKEHVEVPAGRIETATRESNARFVGEATSVEQFRRIVVAYRGGAPILLEQVAVVEDGLSDRRRAARAMGVPSIGLGIKKQYGANAVEVARGVRRRVEELQKGLPAGMLLEVNSDRTVFIEESIHEIQFTLVLSVVLTSLVCWFFLGSWSSTFNILLSIPTSIVGAFILIYFLGFTLNVFTLLALSLAVGIVVDDAIMVLENIVRHREMGKGRTEAASTGAREITLAAAAATLSIMAIFLPIAFLKGIVGKFLYQFGMTLSVAVALSFLEALTLTPMRCSQMLAAGRRERGLGGLIDRFHAATARAYRALLGPCLKARWLVVLGSLAVFAGSLNYARGLRFEIIPPQDQSMVIIRISTPVGSSLDYTEQRTLECERWLAAHGAVRRWFSSVGGFEGGEVDSGFIFVTLKPPAERPGGLTQAQFEAQVRQHLGGIPGLVAVRPAGLQLQGLVPRGSQFPIQFAVTGPEWGTLGALSEQFADRCRRSGLMVDVKSDYLVGMPEVKVQPDRRRAADFGVSALAIGETVNAMIGGVRAGKYKEGGHRYDVRVRLLSDQRSRPEDVQRLFVRNARGGLVRLSEVVSVAEEPSVQTITRYDRTRAVTVSANLAPGASQKTANDLIEAAAEELLPAGYGLRFTGSSLLFRDLGTSFRDALLLGLIVSYMILASQFNSFVHPLLVLLAMPFSITGAILAMRWGDVSLNLYSMIGFVLLMGLVKKNSILLVEFTNHVRAEGKGVREALLEACPVRLRPILMTSISTVAAALPAALAIGPGAESRIPMALVVIGGMSLSTVFTLFVVPCAYLILPGRVVAAAPAASTSPAASPGA
jgi:HAE1 family hydrophobic/amphiphilic exporter-1